MGIDFSSKIIVTNPTIYSLGKSVIGLGLFLIAVGLITKGTGDFLIPAMAWAAFGVTIFVIGGIMMWSAASRS